MSTFSRGILPKCQVNAQIALKFSNLSIFPLKFPRFSKILLMSKIPKKKNSFRNYVPKPKVGGFYVSCGQGTDSFLKKFRGFRNIRNPSCRRGLLRMDSFAEYVFSRRICSLEFFGVGIYHKRLQTIRYPVLVKRPFL